MTACFLGSMQGLPARVYRGIRRHAPTLLGETCADAFDGFHDDVLDVWERFLGRRDALTPPRRLRRRYAGTGDFKRIGRDFLEHFKNVGGLTPDERVLDVGCGIGRMALALTGYLNRDATYEGFDIVRPAIDWCARTITPRHPNFQFQLSDVFSAQYNPSGRWDAAQYAFPYADGAFTFAFLTSVFTHMGPDGVRRYLGEVARVLDAGGRCFISFYLLNRESLSGIERGKATPDFRCVRGRYRTVGEASLLESAVAYDEGYVRELFERNGLGIVEPIHYGTWSSRSDGLSHQDIVVATKAG